MAVIVVVSSRRSESDFDWCLTDLYFKEIGILFQGLKIQFFVSSCQINHIFSSNSRNICLFIVFFYLERNKKLIYKIQSECPAHLRPVKVARRLQHQVRIQSDTLLTR